MYENGDAVHGNGEQHQTDITSSGEASGGILGGEGRHGACLSADVGGDLDSPLVRLSHRLSPYHTRHEGGSKGVPGSDGIRHLDLRRRLVGHALRGKDVAAIDPAGQDQHPEVVPIEQGPALAPEVGTGVAEQPADDDQFFIINLQHVALLHRLIEDLLGKKSLPEIHVKDNQTILILRHRIDKAVDGRAREAAPLRQRAEADSGGPLCESLKFGSEGDIVPRHTLPDDILRHADLIFYLHLHCTGRVRDDGDMGAETVGAEVIQDLTAERVLPDGTDDTAG